MKNNVLFLSVIFLFTISCKSGVEIVFINKSAENFKSLKADIGKKDTIFENLKSGESTKPIRVAGSYSYCYLKVITEQDTLSYIPTDYMGEKYYTSGKLKMKVEIEKDENGKRRLKFAD